MDSRHAQSGNAAEGGSPREMIRVSDYNRLAIGDAVGRRVDIFDTTLRDGEQTPGIALSVDDKVRIAEALDELGVDIIEAGFPISSAGEREAVRRIVDLDLGCRVCGLARSNRKDIDAALECGVDHVHTFIATSDLHLQHKLHMTREEVRAHAVEAVEYAVSHGVTVEFSCEDATRTDLDFLKEMHLAVQEAGVERINLPDTVGVISPPAMEYLVSELMEVTEVPLSVHCHDDFGLAVANSIAAVRAGAGQVHVCVNGLGERSGNAALEEVVLSLKAFFDISTNVDTTRIGPVSKAVSRITGYPIPNNKAIVGNNAFAHESGIHVHGVLGDPFTYEAFSPELVGMKRNIVMGKHSGAHSVMEKLKGLGVEVPGDRFPAVVEEVKRLAESGKQVDDTELMVLANYIAGTRREEDRVKLVEFAVFTGNNFTPTAVVAVDIDGEVRRGSQIGIGPVDASLNAIRSVVGGNLALEEFRLSAISGGSDALCEATVLLKEENGDSRLAVGRSVGTDIVRSSVEATMEAINRKFSRIKE